MGIMATAPTDSELADRASQGDRKAFAALASRYARPLYAFCRRIMGDAAEAEDRTQEAFLRAYQNLERFDPQRSFSPWLYRIAQNACIDVLRQRKAWSPLPADQEASLKAPPLLRHQDLGDLQEVVAQLPGKYQAVLHLKYTEGLSAPEIGDALGMTPGGVRVTLHRAIRLLREKVST
jgi:RNA polymerase sigma-70 factor (ECF subfamily)